ncbi:hypothetical protein EYC84_009734 [Monilinia fructicola]|uniref:Serine/threonine-protein phosphatase 2A activator n=1 Tax=Monilinia fructicola TaxID=38448 RepID=A0A5M9JC24_MONFR|nr:hypothetical protein EYC84_009734 [Monilinia fructicola]
MHQKPHTFQKPIKRIHEGHDVPHFLVSKAYADIGVFVMQLNISMCPRKSLERGQDPKTWRLDTPLELSDPVKKLQELLQNIDSIIDEVPPDKGPRRFGNVSFRKWYEILETRAKDLLKEYLPAEVLGFGGGSSDEEVSALDELTSYFLGGFGSAQRLDYGTGHELSFLAFLGCVIEPYLRVIRRLILTYTLEPAGSHGVWGLDDHSFLPYIFGSSQYCPAITDDDSMPVEGSLPESPKPGDVAKKMVVDRERKNNMGMIKMYNAEVLSKFPVVQHFPFGSLFSWDQDPHAVPAPQTVHVANQPTGSGGTPTSRPEGTRAPWSNPSQTQGIPLPTANTPQIPGMPSTTAPWANVPSTAGAIPSTRRNIPPTSTTATHSTPHPRPLPASSTPTTRPWPNSNVPPTSSTAPHTDNGQTRAPWAK